MAWDLLTRVYGLPKDRLYVTYFEGDAAQGLEPDTEAQSVFFYPFELCANSRQLWRDLGVAESHILPGNTQDNFWGESRRCLCNILLIDRDGSYRPVWSLQVRPSYYNDAFADI